MRDCAPIFNTITPNILVTAPLGGLLRAARILDNAPIAIPDTASTGQECFYRRTAGFSTSPLALVTYRRSLSNCSATGAIIATGENLRAVMVVGHRYTPFDRLPGRCSLSASPIGDADWEDGR